MGLGFGRLAVKVWLVKPDDSCRDRITPSSTAQGLGSMAVP